MPAASLEQQEFDGTYPYYLDCERYEKLDTTYDGWALFYDMYESEIVIVSGFNYGTQPNRTCKEFEIYVDRSNGIRRWVDIVNNS